MREIEAVFYYLPLEKSTYALQMADRGWRSAECPATEDVSDRLVRLPFHTATTDEDQRTVLDVARS